MVTAAQSGLLKYALAETAADYVQFCSQQARVELLRIVIDNLDAGHAFMASSPIAALLNDDRWHHWNMMYGPDRTRAGKETWLYVPVDLQKHPNYAALRRQLIEARSFARVDDAGNWNELPFEERKLRYEARQSSDALVRGLLEEYQQTKARGDVASAEKVLRDGMANLREAAAVRFRVPADVDPVSYLARIR